MAAQAGKSSVMKVSTTAGGAGSYTAVAGIKSANMSVAGQNIDISTFTSTYVSRIQGLLDATYSLSGNWESGDTNGQVAIRSALINDGVLWVQFLSDGTTGFKQQVRVAKFEIATAVDGVAEVSIELEGTGAVASV